MLKVCFVWVWAVSDGGRGFGHALVCSVLALAQQGGGMSIIIVGLELFTEVSLQ